VGTESAAAVSNGSMTVNLVAAVCIGVIALGSPAAADCDKPRSAVTALKRADVVFRGKVRDIRTYGKPSSVDNPGWRGWIVTFDVSQVWKGSVEQHFVLHNVEVAPDDAFRDFERGSEYLVFATQNPPSKNDYFNVKGPTYGAHGCGGTVSLLWGMSYLVSLGPGREPSGR
jgi:hypothetical protein